MGEAENESCVDELEVELSVLTHFQNINKDWCKYLSYIYVV